MDDIIYALYSGRSEKGRRENSGHSAYMVVCELDSRDHHDPAIPRIPIIIADEATFARRALALDDVRHAEAHVRGRVEWRRVKNGNTVPARLDLDRKMSLESILGCAMVEDRLERSVLERGPVDISCYPVVVEDWMALRHRMISMYPHHNAETKDLPVHHDTCNQLRTLYLRYSFGSAK